MSKKVKTITVKKDGQEVKVVIKKPSREQVRKARIYSSRVLKEAVAGGAMLRSNIEQYLKDSGEWTEEQAKKLSELSQKIIDGEKQLARGGVTEDGKPFTLEQAKELAFNMRKWRAEQIALLARQQELDSYTAEGQADNAFFDYLVYACSFKEDGSKFFVSIDDYLENADEDYAFEISSAVAEMVYDYDPEREKERPENKFLREYGFDKAEEEEQPEEEEIKFTPFVVESS